MTRVLFAAVLSLWLTTSAWAGFDEGVAAYDRGDYATAFEEMLPIAEQGHASAQFNLGNRYANGEGVPQDYAVAMKWYRLAAEQGPVQPRPHVRQRQRRAARLPIWLWDRDCLVRV